MNHDKNSMLHENITRSEITNIQTTDTDYLVEFKNGSKAKVCRGQGDAVLRDIRQNTFRELDRNKLVSNFVLLSLKVKGR